MKRTLVLLPLLLAVMAPLATAGSDAGPDAWPYLVRASSRIKDGRSKLDLARACTNVEMRRKHARDALASFKDASNEAATGLQVADKTLKDGLFDAWNEAKKLEVEAKPLAAAAGKAKKVKKKKKAKKARPADDDDEPQTDGGSYGMVACSRINARRRAIGAPPLCRRGLTRR